MVLDSRSFDVGHQTIELSRKTKGFDDESTQIPSAKHFVLVLGQTMRNILQVVNMATLQMIVNKLFVKNSPPLTHHPQPNHNGRR